jgi:sugar lactone lactonase YvrE
VILNLANEPQPDRYLRIAEDCGGSSHVGEDEYIYGPPELLAEIAHSTVAIDLDQKKVNYAKAGVCEYIVVCVEEKEVFWFDLRRKRQLRRDAKGVIRSRVFPGLWLNVPALLAEHSNKLITTLNEGLASTEHAKCVERLRTAREKRRRKKKP